MPKIPLTPPFRDTDEIARGAGLQRAYDCVFDQTESGFAVSKRPGLWAWWRADEQVGIDGIYWWGNKAVLVVVCNGRAYAFTRPDNAPTEITSSLVRLHINQPVSFATNGTWLLMANGGPIVAWDGVNTAGVLQEPRHADSVTFISSVFVANEQGTNNVRFTAPILETETTRPEFLAFSFTPDANPDKLMAVAAGWSELLLFGPKSVEPWAYSGASETAPFQRLSGAYIERGVGAKNTIIQANNAWYWLDNECKFVTSNGRNVSVVSSPFDRAFRSINKFDDAWSFLCMGRFICIVLPSADQCFVYDLYNQGWSEWSWWNIELGVRERFIGQCSEYVPDWNTQFIGSRKDGRVLIMHQNLVTDLFNPIRSQFLTNHMDFGTMKLKQSKELLLRLKRGF